MIPSQYYPINRADRSVPGEKNQDAALEAIGAGFAQAMAKVSDPLQDQTETGDQLQIAPPGGSTGVGNDLMRLLGANNEGSNASASVNGQSTAPESFFAQMLRSASGDSDSGEDGAAFTKYIKGVVDKAYH